MKVDVVLSAGIGALAIVVGAMQFSSSFRRDSQRPFLEKQLNACWTVTETAAKLATAQDWPDWKKDRDVFHHYFWGRLAMVENRALEAAMVQFGKLVFPIEEGDTIPVRELQQKSLQIAYACRDLVLDSWDVELEALQGMRN